MEGGSASQGENHDENTNHDANNAENSGQSTGTQSSGIITNFDIAAFSVTFPPGPEPDELVSDNGEDDEGQEAKPSVCCLCFKNNKKLYIIPPQNKASFQELLKNVANSDGGYGVAVPERVCLDCNEILTSITAFRTRALQTNSLLYSLIRPFIYATEQEMSAQAGSGISVIPRCVHRHHSRRPYDPSDENILGRLGRVSFCVLHRARNQPQPQGQEEQTTRNATD